ncbi:O-antigen ligase family protein [Comamonadaceae bacterium OH2545_COT-014]|nr:O-antigen ligase family protein [Comamonadaceae bacterium OH2545_COT-014]
MTGHALTVQRALNAGAFMVPGLALWLPSGYSWGAVWLLLLALWTAPQWGRHPVRANVWALTASVAVMALLFISEAGWARGWAGMDRPAKYLAALPCFFMLAWRGPDPQAVWHGVMAGAWGTGAIALWQVLGQGLVRATGYTNEIQYGNLSLLLGLLCLVALAVRWRDWHAGWRAGLAGGAALGFMASALSQSRGGWLALALALPVLLALAWRFLPRRLMARGSATLALALGALVLALHAPLQSRLALVAQEVQLFEQQGEANTSVGQRLAHWQLAWDMGREKPLWGWGGAEYVREKADRARRGETSHAVTGYDHVHNEMLDIFVRRGLLGVLGLLAFYLVPLTVFWPTRARLAAVADASPDALGESARRSALALRLAGVSVVLAYMGFGLTQVFFAHNSGNLFYLFMLALLYGALHRSETARPDGRA